MAEPVVAIAEVLPLPPSRTIGNVGGKHRSQTTQLGKTEVKSVHMMAENYSGECKHDKDGFVHKKYINWLL